MCLQKATTVLIFSICCSFVICDKYDYNVSENIDVSQNIFEREKCIFIEIGKLYKLLHDKIGLMNTTMKQQVSMKQRRLKHSTDVFSKLVNFPTAATLESVDNKELESSSWTKPIANTWLSSEKANHGRMRINKNITESLTKFNESTNDAYLGVDCERIISNGSTKFSRADLIYSGSEKVRSKLNP